VASPGDHPDGGWNIIIVGGGLYGSTRTLWTNLVPIVCAAKNVDDAKNVYDNIDDNDDYQYRHEHESNSRVHGSRRCGSQYGGRRQQRRQRIRLATTQNLSRSRNLGPQADATRKLSRGSERYVLVLSYL
jgi:hypothetical protein